MYENNEKPPKIDTSIYDSLSTQEVIELVSHYIVNNIMQYYHDHRVNLKYLMQIHPLFHEFNEPNYQRDELAEFVYS